MRGPASPTEFEVIRTLIENLKSAEGCCRQLAHMRQDIGWLRVAQIYADQQKKVSILGNKPGGIAGIHPMHKIITH